MHALRNVMPCLALATAAFLVAPRSLGFTKIGGSLDTDQRDFRVFDNFQDPSANSNTTPHPMFPGWTGVEVAIWKGYVEWGSLSHGDGSGDPTQPNLGDGGANFDPAWMGAAEGIGAPGNNVVSASSACEGGVIAFTETGVEGGWRIRFCEQFVWFGGPGLPGGTELDVQAVATHAFGHALGLGHSGVGQATMAPSISGGQYGARSISPDDIAGIQCIYGVMAPSKPTICEVEAVGSSVEITGTNFAATGNEVWFTNGNVSPASVDPRVRVLGVPSSNGGTTISVTIPAEAGPGDLLVKIPGATTGDTLSNAFPSDLSGLIGSGKCAPFTVAGLTPSTVPALAPGTAQFLSVTGDDLDLVTSIDLAGTPIPAASWTLVDPQTITIDLPQAPGLGVQALLLHGPQESSVTMAVTVLAPTTPALQIGTGDPLNVLTQAGGVDVIAAGEPGETHWVYYSTSGAPSNARRLCLSMGNGFTELFFLRRFTIPAAGWVAVHESYTYTGPPAALYLQSIDFGSGANPKFGVSNPQSVTVTP